jgi:hypothetical protein
LKALVAVLLAACSSADDAAVRCELSEEIPIATSEASFDAIAIERLDGSLVAFWSTAEGLFARPLASDGSGHAEARRIGSRCEGGVATSAIDGGVALACLTRRRPESDRRGGALVLRIDRELRVRSRASGGDAGDRSHGISILAMGDAVEVAFQDAGRSSARAWLWPAGGEPRLASRAETLAGPPSLAAIDGQRVLVWAETASAADGTEVGEVRLERESVAPRRVATTVFGDARPVIGVVGERPVVAFRDERPAGSRPRLYLQRLDERWDPDGEAIGIGRADGAAGPRLVSCDGALYAIAPRAYGSEDLVAVHRLDESLSSACGEKQLYDVGRQFGFAEAACVRRDGGEDLVVLAAERGSSDSRTVRLLTMVVRRDR